MYSFNKFSILIILLFYLTGFSNENTAKDYLTLNNRVKKVAKSEQIRTTLNNQKVDSILFDLAKFKIKKKSDSISNDYIFLAANKKGNNHLIIMDNEGFPIYLKEFRSNVMNFSLLENNLLTYYDDGSEKYYLMDEFYELVDSFKIKNGYIQDLHDIKLLENGNIMLIGLDYRIIDMSSIINEGDQNATVVGQVIQELDTDKNIVFEWNTFDYYDIDDSFVDLTSQFIDYAHINSIDIDSNEDLIISVRNLNEVSKIDKNTGEFVWRLGGAHNEFLFSHDSIKFSRQHSVSLVGENLSMFDNGNDREPKISRGIEYKINELNKTIVLDKVFKHKDSIYSFAMGNMQKLDNDNVLIGWGNNEHQTVFYLLTEFDSLGNNLYDVYADEIVYSYRAYKFDWKSKVFSSESDTLDFGNIPYGDSNVLKVAVKNNSQKDYNLTGFQCNKESYDILNELPLKIESQNEVDLFVEFKPGTIGGLLNDKMTIYSDHISDDGRRQRIGFQLVLIASSPDNIPPHVDIFPSDNSTNISVDTTLEVLFSEPIRNLDDSEIEEDDIYYFIKLKESETEVLYNAVINEQKTRIIISPKHALSYETEYKLHVDDFVEDYCDNQIIKKEVLFTTEQQTYTDVNHFLISSIVYPNPTSGKFYLKSTKIVVKIELYNPSGVLKKTIINNEFKNNIEIDISEFSNGLYFLKLFTEDNKIMQYKVLKH